MQQWSTISFSSCGQRENLQHNSSNVTVRFAENFFFTEIVEYYLSGSPSGFLLLLFMSVHKNFSQYLNESVRWQ